jgi:hypothetical protein
VTSSTPLSDDDCRKGFDQGQPAEQPLAFWIRQLMQGAFRPFDSKSSGSKGNGPFLHVHQGTSIDDALNLLLRPMRLVATLRR